MSCFVYQVVTLGGVFVL